MFARVLEPEEQPNSAKLEPNVLVSSGGQTTVREQPPEELEAARLKIRNRTAIMILELGSHTLVLGLALGSLWLTRISHEYMNGNSLSERISV